MLSKFLDQTCFNFENKFSVICFSKKNGRKKCILPINSFFMDEMDYFTRKLMSRCVDRIRTFFRLSCRSPSCKGFWSGWNYRLWSRFRCRSTWKNFENLCVNGPPTRLMSESLNYIVANVISWKCSKLARHLFPIICLFDFNWWSTMAITSSGYSAYKLLLLSFN